MSERNPSNTQPGLSSTGIRAAVSVGGHLHAPQSTKELTAISLAALGVVYGDIGTSPLYALKASIDQFGSEKIAQGDLLGIL